MSKALKTKLHHSEVIVVDRSVIKAKHLVYLFVADRPHRYLWRHSRILYVGTTAKGVARITTSVAARAKDIFARYGVRKFHVRVVTCTKRPGLSSWKVLEKDLLRRFKALHGGVPLLNKQGRNLKPHLLSGLFPEGKLDKILNEF